MSLTPGATLLEFATVNDRVASTPSKLEKQQLLASYFRTLSDTSKPGQSVSGGPRGACEDLSLAVRFTSGRAFASTDERTLGASGATVSDALLSILKIDPRDFYALTVRHGEIGEAIATVWPHRRSPDATHPTPPAATTPLALADLSIAFDDLAATGNVARKREILADLFGRCLDPREAAYLAKIIFSDLRTGVRDGVLIDAIAVAFETDRKLVQQAHLMVGDLGEVAMLAQRRRLDRATFHLFHPIQFMLATPQENAVEAAATMGDRVFFAEDKLDGIRAQVHKSGDGRAARIAIYTRTMDRTDESFPDIVEAIRTVPGDFLLDGEIVPFRDGRVLPFAHIQKRLGRKLLTAKIIRENPAAFIAFDILYRDGQMLMDRPFSQRREALDKLGAQTTTICRVRSAGEIDTCFNLARERGNEGLVLKDPDSLYSPGRRGQAWLKIKTHLATLDCAVTAAEYGHGKRRNVLSDYTFAVWNKDPASHADAQLVNIGKAYSGVSDDEINQLTAIFLKLAREQRWGRVFIVEPKIVLEIAFDQIQPSARHASGYALRFPRIKRIRWDKSPLDADRLARVVEIYQSTANTARREHVERKDEPTLFDGM